jgi:hypothetical protein
MDLSLPCLEGGKARGWNGIGDGVSLYRKIDSS